MYGVEVRDHVMVAHSLKGEVFGPAQRVHGATFVVDAAFFRDRLTPEGVVVDIARARQALRAVLAPLDYRNLDELPEFRGIATTAEFLAKTIFDGMVTAALGGALGPGGDGLAAIRITLHESHIARAWFEGPVAAASRG